MRPGITTRLDRGLPARQSGAGGYLATVSSVEESRFLIGLHRSARSSHSWIGLTDEGHEAYWKWVTGEILEFTAWTPGQPDNGLGREHFGLIWTHRGKFGWNDDAPVPYWFICEWER